MPVRRLSRAVSPLLRFVDWLFGPDAPGPDVFYLGGALWWLYLMLFRQEVFDVPPLVGMEWAPDPFWIGFVLVVSALHALALVRPRSYRVRMGVALISSWYWITIAVSLSRPGVSTGTGMYSLFGGGAALFALYLSGRDQHRV